MEEDRATRRLIGVAVTPGANGYEVNLTGPGSADGSLWTIVDSVVDEHTSFVLSPRPIFRAAVSRLPRDRRSLPAREAISGSTGDPFQGHDRRARPMDMQLRCTPPRPTYRLEMAPCVVARRLNMNRASHGQHTRQAAVRGRSLASTPRTARSQDRPGYVKRSKWRPTTPQVSIYSHLPRL